jgi:hypothetical protein
MQHKVGPVAGRGLGCLALAPLLPGTLLLRELPAVRPAAARPAGLQPPEELERLEFLRIGEALLGLEPAARAGLLRLATAGLPLLGDGVRLAFRDLQQEPGSQRLLLEEFRRLLEVYRTNAFSDGLWPELARVNHSCWPNAEVVAEGTEGGARRLVLLEPVGRGEEVTHSYLHGVQGGLARRARLLERWGFSCGCRLCRLAGPDLARQERLRARYGAAAGAARLHLARRILGFRRADLLQLLEQEWGARPGPLLAREGAALAERLLGPAAGSALRWRRRRDWPRLSRVPGAATSLAAGLWALATMGALAFNFWHGHTTPYCLLLLSITLYSKAP